jgi:restriction endonuclease Mrr
LSELFDLVDNDIHRMRKIQAASSLPGEEWEKLRDHISQIDALLGNTIARPEKWSDLQRHVRFAETHDFTAIEEKDWPVVKEMLRQNMYEANEPIPTEIEDLSVLVNSKPRGAVTRALQWERLSPEQFERLIFSLINATPGYENPQWLTKTNAADRGRDLSVNRVIQDSLAGVIRNRVIIQCKHWLGKSISPGDIELLKGQMQLWEPPKVDVHIIVSSGRFTSDAVAIIEKNNQSDRALRIEMWPESHLEMLLASRPALVAEFNLR